ncbi:DUF2244 domain-containing protein [Rhizobium lusitanum]|nr:DUF2244 domain-containing protein [Rhizobium lusitanum]
MTERNADTAADGNRPVFAAELFPHRSLPRKGFRIMLALAGAVCFFYSVLFVTRGAWPIGIFFGADFLLLYGAFWLNYRSGRVWEEVTVSRTNVSIRKFSPTGRMVAHDFNPFWTRFLVRRHPEIGVVSMHVRDRSHDTDVGSFLNPEDRESFAQAFKRALATVTQRI